MHLTLKSAAGLAAVAGLALVAGAASAQVTITRYSSATDNKATDITFTGAPTATFIEANNFFDTKRDTIALFNSNSATPFGLDVKGSFTVGPGGLNFTFRQQSDDGSYSFLNGQALIAYPGPTSGKTEKSVNKTLAAGIYNYEVRYSESNGAPGSLRFTTPPAVPEPSSVASMGLGAVGLLGLLLRARKVKRVGA